MAKNELSKRESNKPHINPNRKQFKKTFQGGGHVRMLNLKNKSKTQTARILEENNWEMERKAFDIENIRKSQNPESKKPDREKNYS